MCLSIQTFSRPSKRPSWRAVSVSLKAFLKSSVCFDSSSPPWTNRQDKQTSAHKYKHTSHRHKERHGQGIWIMSWCDFLIHVYRKNSRIKCTVVLIKIRSNEWTHSSKLHAIVHTRTHTNTHTRVRARTQMRVCVFVCVRVCTIACNLLEWVHSFDLIFSRRARTHAHLHLEAAVFIDANVRFIRSEIRARRKRHVKACSGDVCPFGGEGHNYKLLFLIFHLI
jgi:hypothetical protein